MRPAPGDRQPANTCHSAKSKNGLGRAPILLFFRSLGREQERLRGLASVLTHGEAGGSSGVGKGSACVNFVFLPWTPTGIRLGPRARGLNPPNPVLQGARRLGRGRDATSKPGHTIPLGRGGSLRGQIN